MWDKWDKYIQYWNVVERLKEEEKRKLQNSDTVNNKLGGNNSGNELQLNSTRNGFNSKQYKEN